MISQNSKVDDDEILYRAVQHGKERVKQVGSALKPSSECFLDPSYKVSVDCASKRRDPAQTQRNATDYICCLTAKEVRGISGINTNDKKGYLVSKHQLDAYYDPLGEHCRIRDRSEQPPNPAHGLIVAHPHVNSKSTFRRVKEALAGIATWEPNFAPTEAN